MYLWKNDRFSLCWDPGGAAVPLETPSPSFFSLEGATLPFLPALLGAILQTGLMGRWPDPTMAIDGRPWQGSRSAAITFSHLYSVEFFPRQSHENKIGEGKYLKKGEAKGVKYLEKENIWPTELKEKEEHI